MSRALTELNNNELFIRLLERQVAIHPSKVQNCILYQYLWQSNSVNASYKAGGLPGFAAQRYFLSPGVETMLKNAYGDNPGK